MPYATRAQLLDRCNLQRLAQLAVPTGGVMPPVDWVQLAMLGQPTGATGPELDALNAAVVAVDTALADGADLMRSYQVPEATTWTGATPAQAVPAVLVRINCQLAMHYLVERAGMLADSDSANYNALLKLLAKHASGEVALVPPPSPAPTTPSTDVAQITSGASRYGY